MGLATVGTLRCRGPSRDLERISVLDFETELGHRVYRWKPALLSAEELEIELSVRGQPPLSLVSLVAKYADIAWRWKFRLEGVLSDWWDLESIAAWPEIRDQPAARGLVGDLTGQEAVWGVLRWDRSSLYEKVRIGEKVGLIVEREQQLPSNGRPRRDSIIFTRFE